MKSYYVIEYSEARLRPNRIAGQSAKKSPYINGPYRKPTQVDG